MEIGRSICSGLGKLRVDFTRLMTSGVLVTFPEDHLLSLKWGR